MEVEVDIILWRHAEAEDTVPDQARRLTAEGEKQAARVAAWLRQRIGREFRVLSSPARRAQQTAVALTEDVQIVPELGTGCGAASLLRAAGWPEGEGTVIVVGHQPTLGEAAARILTGKEAPWSIKKGGVWWFKGKRKDGAPKTALHAVIPPEET